ncbi:MAG: response regulator [Planctomycetes bacterium]|nr:response regulator [Planctomycetota bacterium]
MHTDGHHRLLLVVDDNQGDLILAEEAASEVGMQADVRRESSGGDAISYLEQVSEHHAPRPDLILLDINMPGVNGFEVLTYIKHRPELDDIPVFMLSSSTREADVSEAEHRGADGYLGKPSDFADYVSIMQRLGTWMEGCRHGATSSRRPLSPNVLPGPSRRIGSRAPSAHRTSARRIWHPRRSGG